MNMYSDSFKHTTNLLNLLGNLNIKSAWDSDLDQELIYPFIERMILCLLIRAT